MVVCGRIQWRAQDVNIGGGWGVYTRRKARRSWESGGMPPEKCLKFGSLKWHYSRGVRPTSPSRAHATGRIVAESEQWVRLVMYEARRTEA